jgi:outer membrane protein OmpA-like peptidoglycan-associated protein
MSDGSSLPEDFPISIKLKCQNCTSKNTRQVFPRLRDGFFMSDLEAGKTYELSFFDAEDKKLYTETFTAPTENNSEVYKKVVLNAKKKKITPLKVYSINGNVAENNTVLENVKVEVLNLQTGKVIAAAITDKDGNYKINNIDNVSANSKTNFTVRISKENYISQTFEVNQNESEDENIKKSFNMKKSEIGGDLSKLFDIKSIYFNFNNFSIRKEDRSELNKIIKIMNENPTLEIELSSHTDCRGTVEFNYELANKRAIATAEYIKNRITQPSRIISVSYGETKLNNDCGCEGKTVSTCTEKQHQENRRTEFKIIKK